MFLFNFYDMTLDTETSLRYIRILHMHILASILTHEYTQDTQQLIRKLLPYLNCGSV